MSDWRSAEGDEGELVIGICVGGLSCQFSKNGDMASEV